MYSVLVPVVPTGQMVQTRLKCQTQPKCQARLSRYKGQVLVTFVSRMKIGGLVVLYQISSIHCYQAQSCHDIYIYIIIIYILLYYYIIIIYILLYYYIIILYYYIIILLYYYIIILYYYIILLLLYYYYIYIIIIGFNQLNYNNYHKASYCPPRPN